MPIKFNGVNTSNLSINNVQSDVQAKSEVVLTNYNTLPTGEKINYTEVDFDLAVNDLTLAIQCIRELGIDTQKYDAFLSDIKNEVAKSSGEKVSYGPSLAKLQVLKDQLSVYNNYVSIYNSCLYIKSQLDENISKKELLNLVSKMIANLMGLDGVNNISFDNKKKIIDEIYEIVYAVIKKEIAITGESQLYLFIKDKENHAKRLNLIILKELENMEMGSLLEKKVYEIKQHGFDSSYVNLDLIKLIMCQSGEYNLTDSIEEELRNKINAMNKRTSESRELLSKIDGEEWRIAHLESMRDNSKKTIKSTIINFLVIASLFITGSFHITKAFKKTNIKPYYEETTRIYSSATGEETEDTVEVAGKEYGDKKAKIILYDDYDGSGERKYVEFDVSDYDFETPEEYYKQGFEYDLFPDGFGIDNEPSTYEDSYSEVIVKTYKYLGEREDNSVLQKILLALLYAVYISILTLIDLFRSLLALKISSVTYDDSWVESLPKLLGEIESYKKSDKNVKTRIADINKIVSELYSKITHNEQLKQQFEEMYEKNLFLLDHKDVLKSRFDAAVGELQELHVRFDESDSVKRYIREK